MLTLAERDNIRAYSEVALSAMLSHGELRGGVDGALAKMGIEGSPVPPYVLIVEAKRGVEGHEPVTQLLSGLLCAAWTNHRQKPRSEHHLCGVFTVSDVWTFVDATITDMDGDRPLIRIASSREYTEKTEAATIVLLLKAMVAELLR